MISSVRYSFILGSSGDVLRGISAALSNVRLGVLKAMLSVYLRMSKRL